MALMFDFVVQGTTVSQSILLPFSSITCTARRIPYKHKALGRLASGSQEFNLLRPKPHKRPEYTQLLHMRLNPRPSLFIGREYSDHRQVLVCMASGPDLHLALGFALETTAASLGPSTRRTANPEPQTLKALKHLLSLDDCPS